MAGIIGGCVAGGLAILILVIVLLVRSGNNAPPPIVQRPPANPGAVQVGAQVGGPGAAPVGGVAAFQATSYNLTLREGGEDVRNFTFQQGQHITVTVTTRGGLLRNPDVDLNITQIGNPAFTLFDVDLSKDCMLNFIVPATGQYEIAVDNLGPGTANCTVNIR